MASTALRTWLAFVLFWIPHVANASLEEATYAEDCLSESAALSMLQKAARQHRAPMQAAAEDSRPSAPLIQADVKVIVNDTASAQIRTESQTQTMTLAQSMSTPEFVGAVGVILIIMISIVVVYSLLDMQFMADQTPSGNDKTYPVWGSALANESMEVSGISSAYRRTQPRIGSGRLSAFTLCEALVVPETKNLVCEIEKKLKRERNDVSFYITSKATPEFQSLPLVHVRAQEVDTEEPRIILEHTKKGEMVAFVVTTELWANVPEPTFHIYWPSGTHYGSIQKKNGMYTLFRTKKILLTFFGGFQTQKITVMNESNQCVAFTSAVSPSRYQVTIEECVDASIVLLGLMVISKNERMGIRGSELLMDAAGKLQLKGIPGLMNRSLLLNEGAQFKDVDNKEEDDKEGQFVTPPESPFISAKLPKFATLGS